MKIALLVPHIGEFKNYFNFFLTSCAKNKSIDFLFFTDNKKYLEKKFAPNIKFIEMNFEEIIRRAQGLFDFKISMLNPYKICDFRPCFGLMFKEYLEEYDYWGHCDSDMIFGDIYGLLSEILECGKYDRILRHGHLSLYKNNEFANNVFKEKFDDVLNFEIAFSDPKTKAFDEAGGTAILWLKHYPEKLYENLEIFGNPICTSRSFKESHRKGYLRYYKYKNERLFDCYFKGFKEIEKEILYVHFYRRKLKIFASESSLDFFVTPNKVIDSISTFSFVRRILWTCRPLFYWEYYFSRLRAKILK